jgi:hypothetical protein
VKAKPNWDALDDLIKTTRELVETRFGGNAWIVSAMAQRTSVEEKVNGAIACVTIPFIEHSVPNVPNALHCSTVLACRVYICGFASLLESILIFSQGTGRDSLQVRNSPDGSSRHV